MEKETICFIFTGRIAVITSNALSPKPQGEPLFSTFAHNFLPIDFHPPCF